MTKQIVYDKLEKFLDGLLTAADDHISQHSVK